MSSSIQRAAAGLGLVALLAGCATRERPDPAYFAIDPGRLPPADAVLDIPGLGPCTDSPDRRLRLNASQPVHVLVHGCFGSSGQFRGLAQVLAFQGQQTACFTYDDRDALERSATALRQALNGLAEQTRTPEITLIGHSQGALVSRRAATALPLPPPRRAADLKLVTISGPFDGIEAAATCGKRWLQWASLGLLPASCYAVTGAKWKDITPASRFIREPGALDPQISRYLKIDTDERDTCRREEGGRCVESDDIFSLAEQRHPQIEGDARAQRVEVRAGHVEIVGDQRVAPIKLIAVLQQQGVIRPTPPEQMAAFRAALARIYRDEALRTQAAANAR